MVIYSKNVFLLDGLPQILKDNSHEELKENVSQSLREKCPNTEFFSGSYFPAFGPEKTPYLETSRSEYFLDQEKDTGKDS